MILRSFTTTLSASPITIGSYIEIASREWMPPFTMSLTRRPPAPALSPLPHLVPHVIGVSPQEEMVGSDTTGSIASMKYLETIRNRLNPCLVGQPMGTLLSPLEVSLPVSVLIDSQLPEPTSGFGIDHHAIRQVLSGGLCSTHGGSLS